MQYKFKVVETRTVSAEYVVEADTFEKARELAERGETTFEQCDEDYEVIDRTVLHAL